MARRRMTSAELDRALAPVAPSPPPRLLVSPEPRTLLQLLLDTSGSMAFSGALKAVLYALPEFREAILKHALTARKLGFAVLTFADRPEVLKTYGPVTEWEPPTELGGGNGTAMGTAILEALRLQDEHIEALAAQAITVQHSLMFLITDGYPNSEPRERFEEAIRLIEVKEKENRLSFFTVAVEGADINTLKRLTPRRTPLKLGELKDFHNFVDWLWRSMVSVSMTQPGMRISLPNPMKTKPRRDGEGARPEGALDDKEGSNENPIGWAELP